MCRLFGMSGGHERLAATFWLVQAPDSLAVQSHRDPDGTGLGAFAADGRPIVDKQPLAAYADRAFGHEARELHSRTFIAHIRYASNGPIALANTHPFEQRDRLFAHNGVIGETGRLDAELGPEGRALVHGETDSERFFALITRRIEAGADVGSAITQTARWIAANLPVYSLNCIVITATELWALRFPDTHELYVLERAAGGPAGTDHLDHSGDPRELRVHSASLASHPSVVVASEPMDSDPGWRLLEPGSLLHVDPDLLTTVRPALTATPARLMSLADLDPRAARSQSKQ